MVEYRFKACFLQAYIETWPLKKISFFINGAFLSAGTDLNSSLNEQCGDVISYSQSHSCDIVGNYIGVWFVSDGVQIFDEDYYGYGRHISFQEIGAFSTINIGPLSLLKFDGDAKNDVMLAVEGAKEQKCEL